MTEAADESISPRLHLGHAKLYRQYIGACINKITREQFQTCWIVVYAYSWILDLPDMSSWVHIIFFG